MRQQKSKSILTLCQNSDILTMLTRCQYKNGVIILTGGALYEMDGSGNWLEGQRFRRRTFILVPAVSAAVMKAPAFRRMIWSSSAKIF